MKLSFLIFWSLPTKAGAFWSYPSSTATKQAQTQQDEPPLSDLVSPIVNRELEATVKAHSWPFTPQSIACEAWAYHHNDWNWMDRFVALMSSSDEDYSTSASAKQVTDLVRAATDGQMNQALLVYSLSLRANSPFCELHRGMARAHVLKRPSLISKNAFVVEEDDLLPGEKTQGGAGPGPLQVLYANLATVEFAAAYQQLKESNQQFVVRHLGNVAFEEIGGDVVVLQGYGVRLDVKNVEYKVFEDPNHEPDSNLVNVTLLESLSKHTLAGVDVSLLDLDLQIQADLWKVHEGQQVRSQLLPPNWQRRQLSLQAATVVAASNKDVLMTLEEVSQNLPSVASTLVHVVIPEPIAQMAELMEQGMQPNQGVSLTVNGRPIAINRPSFNVFELIQVLKEEQAALDDMKKKLGGSLDMPALQQVQKAWGMGESSFLAKEKNDVASSVTRIDVGRGHGQAVIYVNDVERDAQYQRWPRQVKQILYSMQYGSPPSVRRNLFTVLAVVDPLDPPPSAAMQLGGQLMQSQYPARLGMLIVSQVDLDSCASWIAEKKISNDKIPCPVKPIFNNGGKVPTMDDLTKVAATTQGMHRLFALVSVKFARLEILAVYAQHFTDRLAQKLALTANGYITMSAVVDLHAQLLESFDAMNYSGAVQQALEALADDEDVEEETLPLYGKALRFALNKGIKPGMGFVNGLVLPSTENPQDIGALFMEEQQHLFDLIMRDEINDKGPKSVYGFLLSGSNVFPRIHPLLAQSKDAKHSHLDLEHDFSTDSLLFPKTHVRNSKAEAVFVIEAVLDFDSQEGKTLASSFIKAMDEFPDSVGPAGSGTKVSVAYRLIPSTSGKNSRRLCPILSKASELGASVLTALLNNDDEIEDPAANACAVHAPTDFAATNYVMANGRVFAPDTALIREDIELLLSLELSQAKAATQLLASSLSFHEPSCHDVVARVAKFLAVKHKESKVGREDLLVEVDQIEQKASIGTNPLRFAYNMDSGDDLRISVSAIVDPVSESAQRVAPLLRAMRDNLKLPLALVLAPRTLMDAGDKISSYYRFVAEPSNLPDVTPPHAIFSNLPTNHILTLRLDIPESWNIQQTFTIQDTDNLRCDLEAGCSDDAHAGGVDESIGAHERRYVTRVEYELKNLLFFGQCYDAATKSSPNGLMLTLTKKDLESMPSIAEVEADGSITMPALHLSHAYSDTLVMKNVGYWQLRGSPGVWNLNIAPSSRGAEIFDVVEGKMSRSSGIKVTGLSANNATKTIVMKDFLGKGELLLVKRRKGYEKATLFYDDQSKKITSADEVINVFSLATGHLYERFLKIMMLSVTKRTSSKVKFWLFENFLSPSFKASAKHMAREIGCEVEFVTYKWPEWLRGQSEKQRIIWGYKILFLDVLFPLDVKKIIYVDADQVVRGDLKELWDMDLQGAPYGYTPMCSSRETTLGFQFWRGGFWESHLRGKPYHISALYVVDLEKFRKDLVGDVLRSVYQQLSADPNSLSNLDQDLPNYAQHQVPIFSLPQEWLWCESWCSDESKESAKTIDLCNNPLHKEPKVSMAKRIISGDLFQESWIDLDAEVEKYEKDYLTGNASSL